MEQATRNALFENPEVAQRVLETFMNLNDQMDSCIVDVEKNVSPEEFRAFKKAVGYVLYGAFDKVIEPICKRHPSFKTPGNARLKSSSKCAILR